MNPQSKLYYGHDRVLHPSLTLGLTSPRPAMNGGGCGNVPVERDEGKGGDTNPGPEGEGHRVCVLEVGVDRQQGQGRERVTLVMDGARADWTDTGPALNSVIVSLQSCLEHLVEMISMPVLEDCSAPSSGHT